MDRMQQMSSYQQGPVAGNPRQTEAWALTQAALRISKAKESGDVEEMAAAVRLNWRLWTIFQSDLLAQDCPLPDEIRSNVLSLAAFIDKQTLAFMADRDPSSLDVLVNINRELSMGLYQQSQSAETAEQSATIENATPPVSVDLSDLEA